MLLVFISFCCANCFRIATTESAVSCDNRTASAMRACTKFILIVKLIKSGLIRILPSPETLIVAEFFLESLQESRMEIDRVTRRILVILIFFSEMQNQIYFITGGWRQAGVNRQPIRYIPIQKVIHFDYSHFRMRT